jgi:hypothetical protein
MSVAIHNNYQLKPHSKVDEDNTPEVLCNLREISIPVDNDVVFGVDSDNDTIVVNDPGSQKFLRSGDM